MEEQVGTEAPYSTGFEILHLVRGTTLTPWAEISCLTAITENKHIRSIMLGAGKEAPQKHLGEKVS